jgi:hypothetical protein
MVSQAIAASVRCFGPRHLPDAFIWLREQIRIGVTIQLGATLTSCLTNIVSSLKGTRQDWEGAMRALGESLGDQMDCKIPLAMLAAAVRFTFTGEQQYQT